VGNNRVVYIAVLECHPTRPTVLMSTTNINIIIIITLSVCKMVKNNVKIGAQADRATLSE
jgi:hypothetical protein